MNTFELDHIADTGADFNDAIDSRLGGDTVDVILTGQTHVPNDYDMFAAGLDGVATPPNMDQARLLPVGQNQHQFPSMIGRYFGFPWQTESGIAVYPGVVLDRTTRDELVITYLGAPDDALDPKAIELTDLQPGLLEKISALQAAGTGSVASHNRSSMAVGRELGHGVLAFASVLKPALLHGEHMTHEWTDSPSGIAGNVTNPDLEDGVALYDVVLPNGYTRAVREKTVTLTSGFVVDHPEFHRVGTDPENVQNFIAGMGILALNSQVNEASAFDATGTNKLTERIVSAMDAL